MPLESGMYYIILDDINFTINPTIYRKPRSDKSIVKSKNLTATIVQQWAILASDKDIYMEWSNLDKTQLDYLITKYDTAATYSFTDVYNATYTVAIANLSWSRIGFLDSQGFNVKLELYVTT